MSTINFKTTILFLAAAILFLTISSCRTHNGRACPSYGSSAVKAEKQA
jgi:hypothetical protein